MKDDLIDGQMGMDELLGDLNKNYTEVEKDVGKSVFDSYNTERKKTGAKHNDSIEKKVYNENNSGDTIDGMLYKNLDTVLHESMIPYSEHVILDRALPRVEDGLKPVQRRILYAMSELGLTPDKPYKKSARIVGECLGKYHPHGDSSVYDAMVRMAQPFNMNEILVSGHGNFGSVDGDSAAAMRYTEARLAPLAMELLKDLEKDTVKWSLNFDDTLKEPDILPGRFPNLLVNGSTGIAVGLATNIPPHNLAETIDGVVAYINNPKIKLKDLMKIIKGPDFPTGAYILSTSELEQAYETGRGKIYLRAKMHIEGQDTDKRCIVITELPYQVNKSALLQKIAEYKEENKYDLEGIAEIRDESDRQGERAVIRLKKDANLKKIYNSLLQNTELQGTFGINMVAIAGGKPKQMGLLDIISYYAEYQREVVYRRTNYDLEQAKEREHILQGLVIAIKNIDAVVKIIKTSQNTTEAKKRLREKFILSEKQAQAILDMRLARLTSLEVNKLEDELKRLTELIKELSGIVASEKKQYDIVKQELLQIKKLYKSERKTQFMQVDGEEQLKTKEEEKPEAKEVVVLKTANEMLKAVPMKQFTLAQKELKETSTLNEVHPIMLTTTSDKTLLAFTNFGNCYKAPVKALGESRYKDKGMADYAFIKGLNKNEHIVALFEDNLETLSDDNIIFVTKLGMIKKTACKEYNLAKKSYQAIKLKEDDEVINITLEPKDKYTIMFVTAQGMVLNAKTGDVPLQGRVSGGVKGIMLGVKDYCVGGDLCVSDEGEVLVVTEKGYAKRVVASLIEPMTRYRKGLKLINSGKDTGERFIFAKMVTNEKTLCAQDDELNNHFKSSDQISIETRTTKGKPIDKLKKSLTIKKVFLV